MAGDTAQIGQCYNDSEFTSSSGFVLTLSGSTTDSTHTITLTTGTGQSFADNANKLTNAPVYNQSNGVGLKSTAAYAGVMGGTDDYVIIRGIQTKGTVTTSGGVDGFSMADAWFDGLICESTGIVNSDHFAAFGIYGAGAKATNCIGIQRSSAAHHIVSCGNSAKLINCTLIAPSDLATKSTVGINGSYGACVIKNCAVFGATAVAGGSSTFSFTTCMTDVASPPTGCTSETFANQFQNTTTASLDPRLKTGANCLDTATTDSTDIPAAIDVVGTSRPQGSAWDIGAWELVVAAAGGNVPYNPWPQAAPVLAQ